MRLLIPYINPIQFVEAEPVEIPQYVSKHMDDYLHAERLIRGQHTPNGPYRQPWQNNDVVFLQFENNMGQITVEVIDCRQRVYSTLIATQVRQNEMEPEYYIYEVAGALTGLPEGVYWMVLSVGSPVVLTMVSEPLWVAAEQPGTLLIEYTHRTFREGMIFQTGITPSIRVNGLIRKKPTASRDTVFEDQEADMVMVKSVPYRVWELIMEWVPDWMEDKLARILGCSNVKIDGRYYTKAEGANFEPSDEVGYGALSSYRMELRETIGRNSKVIDSEVQETEELTIVLNTTSKGFADTSSNASSSVVTFFDVE